MLNATVAIASAMLAVVLHAAMPAPPDQPLPRRAGPLGLRFGSAANDQLAVESVVPGSPAAKAGVAAGCTLQSVNGKEIHSRDELREAMRNVKGGETV